MNKWPPITIIIVTLNSSRTFEKCLRYIKDQTYPKISEALIVDGGSTDDTLEIAKKSGLPVRIINGGYKYNQEARRAVGIGKAKSEICVFIDTDNFIEDKKWLERMVEPLLIEKSVVASQTLRYSVPKNASMLNRYFGLLGASDPIAYYLGKADRLSFAFDHWNLLGKIVSENKKYYIIDFQPNNYPTVGCNGVIFRRSILLKSNWKNPESYMHTDVFVDIGRLGYNRFAIVKNEIFHNTSDNIVNFLKKRRNYMLVHHKHLGGIRRYKVFNSNRFEDLLKLLLFIVLSLTLIQPILFSIKGYLKKKDVAWFLHPLLCFGIMVVYSQAILVSSLKMKK